MGLSNRLTKFLKKHKVHYEIQVHPKTFTALDTAEADQVSGKAVAKVVMVKAAGKDVMIVLPAHRIVDLFKVSAALGTRDVQIEEEREFEHLFLDCEVGAMPPFGKMYGVTCYADQSLRDEDEIYFNAGNHWETIKVSTTDFLRVSKAGVGDFSVISRRLAV